MEEKGKLPQKKSERGSIMLKELNSELLTLLANHWSTQKRKGMDKAKYYGGVALPLACEHFELVNAFSGCQKKIE